MNKPSPRPTWGDSAAPSAAARVPPHSEESEQSLLGSLLQENGAYNLVADLVDEHSFYRWEHRLVWSALERLVRAGKPADAVTVHDEMRRGAGDDGLVQESGGLAYLQALALSVPTARNARRYAEIVAERYAERALIQACDDAAQLAWDDGVSVDDRLDRITSLVSRAERLRKGVGARIPVLNLGQLRAQAAGVRWAVKHIIPAASVGLLYGGSGTFKSFIALDACLHVAYGLPWMGRITRQAQVLYIAGEGGAGLWSRIHAWHSHRGMQWQDDGPFRVVPVAVDLTNDAWRVVDAAQAAGVTPGMVVVDTLSQTYMGEENSANEMAAYLREIGLRMRDLWHCAVVLVHHTGHSATERPRGSSAIKANVDFMLSVWRDEKEMLATVGCAKQKDGELFKDAPFQMHVVPLGADEDGDPVTSLVARHLSSSDELAQAQADEAAAGRSGHGSTLMGMVTNGMQESELRKAFYEHLGPLEADAKRQAYYRARKRAVDGGLIDVAEGFVIDLRRR